MTKEQQVAIKKIQKLIKQNIYPTEFDPKIWNGDIAHRTNCYAYAINAYIPNPSCGFSFYYPGMFSKEENPYPNYTRKGLIASFKKDMKNLGLILVESSLEEPLKEGEHKVLLTISSDNGDFHFLRQDRDGFWSHKMSWYSYPTNKDHNSERIVNPEKATTSYRKVKYYKIIVNQ